MTTSIFRVAVPEQFKLATRPNGVEARTYVLHVLHSHSEVELDFLGMTPSPSFADECVGILCRTLGWDEFRRRVHLKNVPEESRSLIKHVVLKRRGEHAVPA